MALFRLGRKERPFGLDIGSSAVRVVDLAEGRGGYALQAIASVSLPRDVIADGTIKDPGTVSDAIKECLDKAGLKSKAAVISVSGREGMTKRVTLPSAPPKELALAIPTEAEHHIPFAIDDVFLDFQVVGQAGTTMDVMLVAVKRVKVLEYVAAAEEAGLEPVVVDLDDFAIQNQYELNNPAEAGEAVALIDIGASIMKTNVVRGGASIFARDVPFGGHHYTDAIAQRLNLPFDKAEAAKHGQDVGVNWDDLVPALETVSRELSLEVQRTFDYFASTSESERIGKIVLSGGGARLAGLDEFLSSSWGIPVELARPFGAIDVDPARVPAAEIEQAGSDYAVAVGLALRRSGDKPA